MGLVVNLILAQIHDQQIVVVQMGRQVGGFQQ